MNQSIPPIIHESWHEYLQPLFNDPKMLMLRDEITPRAKFYPEGKNVFKVFSMPITDIKVVILGQDPYPNGEAIGLAFAVNVDTKMPASLKIIANEVAKDSTLANTNVPVSNRDWKTLHHWERQGIFLLNTALTVQAGTAASHVGYWKWFTEKVVEIISKNYNPIWMLWGGKAQAFEFNISNGYDINIDEELNKEYLNYNLILKAPHPAAEAYDPTRTAKFSGCNHFVICNKILQLKGLRPIKW